MSHLKPSTVLTFFALVAGATAAQAGVPSPAGLQHAVQQANQSASPADLRPLGSTIGRPSSSVLGPSSPALQQQSPQRPQTPQLLRPAPGIAQ